ncbi:hypothetical protein DFJ43DRAFT_1041925 [Lentinula guzmanii]|uniref:Uncharacterized protein n=1 Tax=Lentinula guzmanii TaxID=2804957 RepID=A0AA38JD33_9AGAR|nr:hypothetical protein DFJ43DRAFT_1041925 [Lentinula guzmanii]
MIFKAPRSTRLPSLTCYHTQLGIKSFRFPGVIRDTDKPINLDKDKQSDSFLLWGVIRYSQSDFQNIASELSFIDNQNLVPSAPKFEPQWQELSQQWTNVLWASRTAASNIVAVCTEFTAVIMPAIANITDGEIPIHEAVEILNDFLSEVEDQHQGSQSISDGFTSLIGALTNFTESFTGYAGKLTESDEQTIQEELQTEITALTANIKQLQIEMGAVGAALGASVFVDAGLLYVFPEFSPVIVGAGLAAVGGSAIGFGLLETELESDYSQRSSDQNQIDTLQEQLATIAQVNATLDSVKSQVDTMSGQLNVSTVIWNAVTSDIQQTINFLQTGERNVSWSICCHVAVY